MVVEHKNGTPGLQRDYSYQLEGSLCAPFTLCPAACRKPRIDDADEGERPQTVEGHVQLVSVTFAYPTRPELPIFRDFSLEVPAGSTMALVGESGSGK